MLLALSKQQSIQGWVLPSLFVVGLVGSFAVGWGRDRLLGKRVIAGLGLPLVILYVGFPLSLMIQGEAEGATWLTTAVFMGGLPLFSGLLAQFPSMFWFARKTPVDQWGPTIETDDWPRLSESPTVFESVEEP